jgi:hypothetical protein
MLGLGMTEGHDTTTPLLAEAIVKFALFHDV